MINAYAEMMYAPKTEAARNYRTMGYWYATGWFFRERLEIDYPDDHSSGFAGWCARRRDEYEAGGVTCLPTVPEMFTEYLAQLKED